MRSLKILPKVTKRDSISVNLFLNEINKIRMINQQEEEILAREIKKGNKKAVHKLISANYRFVVSVAKQYQNNGLELADLINEGCSGLIKAAERYDVTRGFKFISYAVWWIRSNILNAIGRDRRIIRTPFNRQSIRSKIDKFKSDYFVKNGSEPTLEETSDGIEIDIEKLISSIVSTEMTKSFSDPSYVFLDNESGLFFEKFPLDVIASDVFMTDKEVDRQSLAIDVRRVIKTLLDKEKTVINLLFGLDYENIFDEKKAKHYRLLYPEGLTQEEIGLFLDVTTSYVNIIKNKALERMRKGVRAEVLLKYLRVN
ncbi:MAG: RNA polymerase sigma-70 factor [Candidatus Nomurabacteria bacterium GW2011_GWB1_37_5]|uniref:RNA polymerase sigma-70 factor n=1 Tax=Candidatus Nomurabacteria bacterium GW2011_GWB1_37_5 TaxID=1618742 RepID=A0A0G0K3V3_9BACT|nr:MAG: RNA polymerase sigma-70 factor [Candidatus Nomurabacteria bacterium GW2011_GWB1_37_5]